MSGNVAVNVVLYWHMHQPEYRDLHSGEYYLPWTYLHTTKDYVDMVAHIENNPDAKAVVNFAPILLEQIDDYAKQLNSYFEKGTKLRDPLMARLASDELALDDEEKKYIITVCLRANKARLVDRFEVFKELYEVAEAALNSPETLSYYSKQFFVDLMVWYHLAWMAETVRLSDERIISLMKKARHFSYNDRTTLLCVIRDLVCQVVQRYRTLAEEGRLELSMTPYAHPIVPLLIDIESAKEAMPDVSLPENRMYPSGIERSHWHIKKGIEIFERFFGFRPAGCWPSEGSVSEKTIELLSGEGFQWLASGNTVLNNSLKKSETDPSECIHEPYQLQGTSSTCFFRDDDLSDLIGFKYSDWHADDAVANLVHRLETIADSCADKDNAIVSIILDGENAWEHYPDNGYHFISALYDKLTSNEKLNLTTYSEYLSQYEEKITLSHVVAGSWVYGTFSTWIGDKDKNRAWDMLVEAKIAFDKVMQQGSLSEEQKQAAIMQLATCESSDWFWWFGEYNSAESVAMFDEQYRMHLRNLYKLLGISSPEYLNQAFSFGTVEPVSGGAMLPGQYQ